MVHFCSVTFCEDGNKPHYHQTRLYDPPGIDVKHSVSFCSWMNAADSQSVDAQCTLVGVGDTVAAADWRIIERTGLTRRPHTGRLQHGQETQHPDNLHLNTPLWGHCAPPPLFSSIILTLEVNISVKG